MPSIVSVLMALIVAVVVLWLLDLAIPDAAAALVALIVFLWLAFGGAAGRFGFGGPRVGTGTRY
jgi:hypothetical protein